MRAATSSEDCAAFELLGAEHRLEVTVRNLHEFQLLHGSFDAADGFHFRPGIEPNLLDSLNRELRILFVEVDAAARNVAHARDQLRQRRPH